MPAAFVPAGLQQFPSSCNPAFASVAGFSPYCTGLPASFQTMQQQSGNFPVFEGTSLYSFRIDHNVSNNNRLTLRVNASPSTVTGIEVSGQDQPFGQNAYSRTSQQTYRDVAGVAQDTWTLGTSKVNEFRFQYARRGLNYFYNTKIAERLLPGCQHSRLRLFRTRALLLHPARRESLPVHRQFFLEHRTARHQVRRRLQLSSAHATFTVNYGGVYDFGSLTVA